jgi:hypothetical protein
LFELIKKLLLPNNPRYLGVLAGPLRGARLFLNPRNSLRKIFGLYEHELNQWIDNALRQVNTVVDVGANDGYFTFGCAAAFRRLKKNGKIFAFEPQEKAYQQLMMSERRRQLDSDSSANVDIIIRQLFVGSVESARQTTLDALTQTGATQPRRALIKIDAEGAERDVIDGGAHWLKQSNLFLIEVHKEADLSVIQTRFAEAGLELDCIHQRPLPLLGCENRALRNYWLVSQLT